MKRKQESSFSEEKEAKRLLPHKWSLHRFAQLPSTSDELKRRAQDGAPANTVIVADIQTAGRGQQGRTWISPPGNLYASFLLRDDLPPQRAAEPGFVAALAVCDLADTLLTQGAATLKWPNDVLLNGAKLAGILGERPHDNVTIIGIGINIASAPQNLPYPTTSLAAADPTTDVDQALKILLDRFATRLAQWRTQGFAAIRTAWLARGTAPNAPLRVRIGPTHIEGRYAGLDDSGALLLDTPQGRRRIVAGELVS